MKSTAGKKQELQNDLVLSFLAVRQALGYLGLFLPAALLAHAVLGPGPLLPSISAYYHSVMSDVFVGTMAAIGVFLWSYEGYRPVTKEWVTDRRVARIAGAGAFGVALAPVMAVTPTACTLVQCVIGPEAASLLHHVSALMFFAALAVFCLVLFVKSDGPMTAEKCARNRIYRACGWTIIAALVGLIAIALLSGPAVKARIDGVALIFWLETVAIVAFALSWLTKGKTLTPLVRVLERAGL